MLSIYLSSGLSIFNYLSPQSLSIYFYIIIYTSIFDKFIEKEEKKLINLFIVNLSVRCIVQSFSFAWEKFAQ